MEQNNKITNNIKIIGLIEIIIGSVGLIFLFYKIIREWIEGMHSAWPGLTLPAIIFFLAPPSIISFLILKGGILILKGKSKGRIFNLISATGIIGYAVIIFGPLHRLLSLANIIAILFALFLICFFNHSKVKKEFK